MAHAMTDHELNIEELAAYGRVMVRWLTECDVDHRGGYVHIGEHHITIDSAVFAAHVVDLDNDDVVLPVRGGSFFPDVRGWIAAVRAHLIVNGSDGDGVHQLYPDASTSWVP